MSNRPADYTVTAEIAAEAAARLVERRRALIAERGRLQAELQAFTATSRGQFRLKVS